MSNLLMFSGSKSDWRMLYVVTWSCWVRSTSLSFRLSQREILKRFLLCVAMWSQWHKMSNEMRIDTYPVNWGAHHNECVTIFVTLIPFSSLSWISSCYCSVHNTLYLNVHCPAVRPDVVVISNSGQTTMDFGEVAVNQRIVKSIVIQNVSDHPVTVSNEHLDVLCCVVLHSFVASFVCQQLFISFHSHEFVRGLDEVKQNYGSQCDLVHWGAAAWIRLLMNGGGEYSFTIKRV